MIFVGLRPRVILVCLGALLFQWSWCAWVHRCSSGLGVPGCIVVPVVLVCLGALLFQWSWCAWVHCCSSCLGVPGRIVVPVVFDIYMALVQPYLIYCISLWGYSLKSSTMNELFILQKKCVRIISGKTVKVNGIFQHTKPMFYNLKILNVFNLYTYFTAVEGMKILRNRSPKHIMDKFKTSVHSILI